MLRIFLAAALAMLAGTASASGMEETFLVMQTDSGALLRLEYASDGEDERLGIRWYANYGSNEKVKTTRCRHAHEDKPRKLTCNIIDGKHVNRVFEEQPASGDSNALASSIFKRFVGDRLPSSVGGMHGEIFACVLGCPTNSQALAAIWITCAECGMEEDFCHSRYKEHPKVATITADEANLREAPTLRARVAGKLRLNQVLQISEAKSACSEIQTKDGVRVGRWIKVNASETTQVLEGWIFDVYVRYENEQ